MRALVMAAILTSLAIPALAQEDPSKAEANRPQRLEKAYKGMLRRTTREQPVKKTC
jgi:hypothetical protein